jgi:squalene synthase HpnC
MSSLREAISSSNHVNPKTARAGESLVLNDLPRFGPKAPATHLSLSESQKYCKNLALHHYENFSVASFLLPRALRQDFYNVYSYCRWSDDLADEMGSNRESIPLLDWWQRELENCFAGQSHHPVFISLAQTIATHSLAIEPFSNLLKAFKHDQIVNRYDTDQEVIQYCTGSANPVGRILLSMAAVTDPNALQQSDRICTGLQIANFCQDMKRDAARDRIYLPKSRWQECHLTEQAILTGECSDGLARALRSWTPTAHQCMVSGLPLVTTIPRWLARDVQLFVRGGLTILNNIRKANFDVWSGSIEVTKYQKLSLLFRSILNPRSTSVRSFPNRGNATW